MTPAGRWGQKRGVCVWRPVHVFEIHCAALIHSYRVSNLQTLAGLEALQYFPIQACCVEGEVELFWNAQHLQLDFGADFLPTHDGVPLA